jgi:transcriptional regulator GlxA family with amidase domain
MTLLWLKMTNDQNTIHLAVIHYPQALQSAVWGLVELFLLAGQICRERQLPWTFSIDVLTLDQLPQGALAAQPYQALLLPPSLERAFYLAPSSDLLHWLKARHGEGSILCSACAGAFLIAATGLLDGRLATTHWALIELFKTRYPGVRLNADKILVNDGDIITAGGMMSWLDLGLELVAQLTQPAIMHQLGKILVVDTGQREQRYYQQFIPRFSHGDEVIMRVQSRLQADFHKVLRMTELAEAVCLTERTFLRRFVRATGLTPHVYLQRLRVQKACDLLENTREPFESIAGQVGYEDVSACRKLFLRVMGLTPGEFRKRFAGPGRAV